MAPGDEKIVAQRIVEVLSKKHTLPAADAMAAPAANLSGHWNVEIAFAASTSKHALHLTQDGNRLSGLHQGNFLTRDIAGTVSGDAVALASTVTERHGDAISYRFTGKLAGDGMSGELNMGEYLAATWTARRSGAAQ
jgi:L-seryl-tRNA(Ser) seleniumtransferase